MRIERIYLGIFSLFSLTSIILFWAVSKFFAFDSTNDYYIFYLSLVLFFGSGFLFGESLVIRYKLGFNGLTIDERVIDIISFILLLIVFLLNILEYAIFFVKFGSFPIFMPFPDEARLDLAFSGVFHLFARLSLVIIPFFYVSGYRKNLLLICLIVLIGLHFLGGERSVVMFYLLPVLVFRFQSRFTHGLIITGFFLGLTVLGISKYFREGLSEEMSLGLTALGLEDSWSQILYFVFGTIGFEHFIAHNYFISLDYISSMSLSNLTFVHPFLSVFQDVMAPLDFQNRFFGTDSNFYLTSGFFGVFIVDYGVYSLLVVFIVGILFGVLLCSSTIEKGVVFFVFFLVCLYDYIFVYLYPWFYLTVLFLYPNLKFLNKDPELNNIKNFSTEQ